MLRPPWLRRWLRLTLVLIVLSVCVHILQRWWEASRHTDLDSVAGFQSHRDQETRFTAFNIAEFQQSSLYQEQNQYLGPRRPIQPAHPLVRTLTTCTSGTFNPVTRHIRLPNDLYNVTLTPPDAPHDDRARFFNPAILPLPYWSSASAAARGARYVLISRLVTAGLHQESHVCLADICVPLLTSQTSTSETATDDYSSHLPLATANDNDTSTTHDDNHQWTAPIRPRRAQGGGRRPPADTRPCTDSDARLFGSRGGLRCLTTPVKINIPPTPAERCDDVWSAFPDLPGFHDPRAFWSGKGEPLILVNSASQYGCAGLWMVDLRTVFPDIEKVLNRGKRIMGQVTSYPHLTEITRNPRKSRASVEKNWVLWFPGRDEAYIQYELLGKPEDGRSNHPLTLANVDIIELGIGINTTNLNTYTNTRIDGHFKISASGARSVDNKRTRLEQGRTFAKLIGHGLTSTNLTHVDEMPCFGPEDIIDGLGNRGHWHQGSNSLRLILCTRAQARRGECEQDATVEDGRSVHFAIVHRKFTNDMKLPMRYERYVVVWESRAPFQMLAVSKWPLLMSNERAHPWTVEQNWPSMKSGWNASGSFMWMNEKRTHAGRNSDSTSTRAQEFENSAYFMYTPSLAWAWRPHSVLVGEELEEDGDIETMSELGTGYLGDDVLMGIGLDDVNQAFARINVDDLLRCMRICPGVRFKEPHS
ncbi:hypothetical protein H2204_005871 [Knufia peltigerae]|uniref:Uncharacterized protein n=1 Tax=Knufia peltigerae TaxID=1002370 RepID=A0AA38Y4X0_9EURO|nr:hypothetical protein H2204_005871 [Knufia peltigerae]